MTARLAVWWIGEPGAAARGGELESLEAGGLRFRYAADWDGVALSISMPRREAPYESEATSFFANLLPEGLARSRVCARLQISEGNDFGLLAAIGGECAGALSLLPEGVTPDLDPQPYELLDEKTRGALGRDDGLVPLLLGGAETRLSLAGAHDKLPVFADGEELSLPLRHAPSTHILKIAHPTLKHVPENEALVTWFAAELGFDVPEVRLLAVPSMLLVERYDRRRGDAWSVQRLHQEDFCQAAGGPPSRKYELEGGPSLESCVAVVRRHGREPLRDVMRILRWALFNVLAGNSDAHGKNVSLLYDHGAAPRVAPFYDLVCTAAYPRLARDLAMSLGGEADPGKLSHRHLDALSASLGVGRALARRLASELAEGAGAALERATQRFLSIRGDHPILQMVPPIIEKRARRMARW